MIGGHGGIVLAGGLSTRMGSPKPELDWRGTSLLAHVVQLVQRGTGGPVVVICAAGQQLPPLPDEIEVVSDDVPASGVLGGIATGLRVLAGRVDVAYVSATDMPLLHPAFVRRVCDAVSGDAQIALPRAHGHLHPLAAAYRTELAPLAARLVADGLLRPAELFARARTVELDEVVLLADEALRGADPTLDSLFNVNDAVGWDWAQARVRDRPS